MTHPAKFEITFAVMEDQKRKERKRRQYFQKFWNFPPMTGCKVKFEPPIKKRLS